MHQRKKYFVDRKVQGALVLRVIGYWFCCVLTMGTFLLALRLYNGQARFFDWNMADFWLWYGPAVAASVLLLILVLIDVVRLSNRFVGPLLRLRREMRSLGAGEAAKTIRFRDGDFWQDFAEEFNAVAHRMELLEAKASPVQSAKTTFNDADDQPQEDLARLAGKRPGRATSLAVGANGYADNEDELEEV